MSSTSVQASEPLPDRPVNQARPLAEYLPPLAWLGLGVLATVPTHLRWNVGVLAWVAPVGFLLYVRSTSGWRSWLVVLGAAEVAIVLQASKMITEPLPWFYGVVGVPQGAVLAATYVLFEGLRRRLGDAWGLVLFPALMVIVEWLSTSFSPNGSFGSSISNTQLENLPLLQITSLVGLTGIGLLTAAVASWLAVALASEEPRRWLPAGVAIFGLVLVAHAWGSVRLFRDVPGPVVRVAGVVSDVMPVSWAGAGLVALPSSDWKGIDPYHTQMAQVRGIEGGFAVVRPVRWSTSAISDAHGRVRATLSDFEDNDRILMAQLPVGRVETLYSRIGDVLPIACGLVVLIAVGVLLRRRQAS